MNSEPEPKPWQTQDWSQPQSQPGMPANQVKAPTPAEHDAWIGKTLGNKYVVLEVLGKGGMGTVYKARHINLNTVVAVKVLNVIQSAERDKQLRRFDIEAKAASKVRHPNLTSVTDYGLADDDAPYLVMDFVTGNSLGAELEERGRLNPIRAMRIFMQICEGMEAAHNSGIIHRDLKPSNIILEKDTNGEDFVRIVDFGIAKIAVEDNEAAPKLTQTGEIFGSPLYMSPEQCMGYKLDRRSDVYSLGCLMYETLSGSAPFVGANAVKTIFKHINDAPDAQNLQQLRVPPALISVVLETLEKKAENRPQSMEALRQQLIQVISGKVVAKPRQVQAPVGAASKTAPGAAPIRTAPATLKTDNLALGLVVFLIVGVLVVGCIMYLNFIQSLQRIAASNSSPQPALTSTPPAPPSVQPPIGQLQSGQQQLTQQYSQPAPQPPAQPVPQMPAQPVPQMPAQTAPQLPAQLPQFAPIVPQLTQLNGSAPAAQQQFAPSPTLPGDPGYRYGYSQAANMDAMRRAMERTH